MNKALKNVFHVLLVLSLWVAPIVIYVVSVDALGIVRPSLALALVLLFAAVLVSLIVHELGHLFAGKAVGFRFYVLTIGPFMIQKVGDSLRPGINRHLNVGGGLTIMLPETDQFKDSDMFWMILGGPLGNFVLLVFCALALLAFSLLSDGFIESPGAFALFITGFVSLILGAFNMLPMGRNSQLETDGMHLLDLKRGGVRAAAKHKLTAISVSMWSGSRPRDLDKDAIESLLQLTSSEVNHAALAARFIAAVNHLDCGRPAAAEAHLDDIADEVEKNRNALMEGSVYALKAVISAAYRNDRSSAEAFLGRAKKAYVEGQTIAMAEAALLVLDGTVEEGKRCAERGLREADASPDKGGVELEKDILQQLREGVLPDFGVATPHSDAAIAERHEK